MPVGNVAHEWRSNRPADDGHHDQRRPQLRVLSQPANSQGEDRRKSDGHEEKTGEHRVHSNLAAAHGDRDQDNIDGRVDCKHAIRPELTDHSAAAEPANHEQHEPDRSQPSRSLQPGDTRIILKHVVHKEAENAGLRGYIERLCNHAKSEMHAPEHVPVSRNQQ